ncbi:hypothetical protein ACFQZQ_10475 [Lysobacter koreensis]|uniref:Adhesin n=1 Tax=Lysobacter koreensis TaxID=266122 RepID=A0ABW2YMR9_9GAMM
MSRAGWAATMVAAALTPVLALAQVAAPAASGHDHARIHDAAGIGASGRVAINQAAGSGNTQASLAALAIAGDGRGLGGLHARQRPQADLPTALRQRAASARIGAESFAGSAGLVSLNQAAGSGNAQLNLFAIGHGDPAASVAGDIVVLNDAALAAVAGDNRTEGAETASAIREAAIDGGSFRGSQGVVQVNQTAGVGNASVNAIVLQLPRGAL